MNILLPHSQPPSSETSYILEIQLNALKGVSLKSTDDQKLRQTPQLQSMEPKSNLPDLLHRLLFLIRVENKSPESESDGPIFRCTLTRNLELLPKGYLQRPKYIQCVELNHAWGSPKQ